MKTVRFDADLERQLESISRLEGRTQSEVIRAAVQTYCAEVVSRRADLAWAPALGAAQLPASVSRHTGDAFTELLLGKRRRRRHRAR
jgi:hypothetical protein